ncbi:hypothetical protein DFH28DRAFT_1187442 [Melampsora americana]|nr:hypothetical protein DFH28DRAFT_1187442 [Melampsora americana]
MRAQGYYGKEHYWAKVIRTVGGISGVWYHNDLINKGIATLVTRNLSSIGGADKATTWAMYSRAPTTEEAKIIEVANMKINSQQMDNQSREVRENLLASLNANELKDLLATDGNTEDDQDMKQLIEESEVNTEVNSKGNVDDTVLEDEDIVVKPNAKRKIVTEGSEVDTAERMTKEHGNFIIADAARKTKDAKQKLKGTQVVPLEETKVEPQQVEIPRVEPPKAHGQMNVTGAQRNDGTCIIPWKYGMSSKVEGPVHSSTGP